VAPDRALPSYWRTHKPPRLAARTPAGLSARLDTHADAMVLVCLHRTTERRLLVQWCPGTRKALPNGWSRTDRALNGLHGPRHTSTRIHDRNSVAIGTIRGVPSLTTDFRRESVPRVPLMEVWTERRTGLQRRHTRGQKPGRIAERLRSGDIGGPQCLWS
jgi:hypothetical protein